MNDFEFGQWLTYHQTLFTRVTQWLQSDGIDQESQVDLWQAKLGRFSKSIVTSASDQMFSFEQQPHPERHLQILCRICHQADSSQRKRREFARFGDGAVRCPTCRDTGRVTVFVCGSMLERAVRLYGPEQAAKLTTTVACECDAGDRFPRHVRVEQGMILVAGCWRHMERDCPDRIEERWRQVEGAVAEVGGGVVFAGAGS